MAEHNLSLASNRKTRQLLRANSLNASRLFSQALRALADARRVDPGAREITVAIDDWILAPAPWVDVEQRDGVWVPVAGGGSGDDPAAGDGVDDVAS